MALPHITRFFCCMGLETGSKVIGFAHLLISFSLLVASAMFAEAARANVGTVEDAGDGLYTSWHAIASVVAALSAVHVLLAITLLYAVYKRRARALRAWALVMAALLLAALGCALLSSVFGLGASGSDIFVAFLEGVLLFGLLAYCILCVNSYYLLLRSSEDMEGPKTDY